MFLIILSGRAEEFRISFGALPRNGLHLYTPRQRPIHSHYVPLVLTTQTSHSKNRYLGGIGISAGFSSLMLIMAAEMENSSYQLAARWLAGNIWGTSWYQVKALLPYLLLLIPQLLRKAGILDLLLLGEEASLALGVRVDREQRTLLVVAVALAASCISVSGGIGSIGLVAPHMARKFIGGRHYVLLPVSMLLGGLLLLIADTIGRSLFGIIEIPSGIVISVLAAPYFLILLRRQV